jgi:hypothetical protein
MFMGKDDIPAVFSFLLENGYHINTDLTRMLFDSRIDMGGLADRRLSGDRKMIAVGELRSPYNPLHKQIYFNMCQIGGILREPWFP